MKELYKWLLAIIATITVFSLIVGAVILVSNFLFYALLTVIGCIVLGLIAIIIKKVKEEWIDPLFDPYVEHDHPGL